MLCECVYVHECMCVRVCTRQRGRQRGENNEYLAHATQEVKCSLLLIVDNGRLATMNLSDLFHLRI